MKKMYLAIFSIIFCILISIFTVHYSMSIIRGAEEIIDNDINIVEEEEKKEWIKIDLGFLQWQTILNPYYPENGTRYLIRQKFLTHNRYSDYDRYNITITIIWPNSTENDVLVAEYWPANLGSSSISIYNPYDLLVEVKPYGWIKNE